MTTWLLVFMTLVFLVEALRRRDPVLFGIGLSTIIYYTLRSIILRSGLEPPEPPYLFGREAGSLFGHVDLILSLWLACILLIPVPRIDALWKRTKQGAPSRALTHQTRIWPIAALVLGTTAWLVISQGGFGAAQRLIRLGNDGAGGTGIYLAGPSVLLVVALWRIRQDIAQAGKPRAPGCVGLALSFLAFFLDGSRTPIVAGLLALAVGALMRMRIKAKISLRVVSILIVTAIIVPELAIGLRTLRTDSLTQGLVNPPPEATVSKALNAIYYDAFALVVRDAGALYAARDLSLFLDGAVSVVPKAVWPAKPQYQSVGKWLRSQYEPLAINGWPPGAPGEWYLMLGLLGIPIGAAVTVAVGRLVLRVGLSIDRDIGIELCALWSLVVLPAGVDTELIARAVTWIGLPLAYVYVSRTRRAANLEPGMAESNMKGSS